MMSVPPPGSGARTAFGSGPWPRLPLLERAEILTRFARELEIATDPVTEVLIAETGLTVGQSRGGALTMPGLLRYYTSLADETELTKLRTGVSGVSARIE
ncbi:aldehyde dehydrogenase family protein [Streptomyces sp. NPDC059256]|uniref:aldehyde dehydrogenase family protein n=1 Tax=Streptomyces sp. NPDC059256 TaxID=3346794 RepID=UPI0036934586